MRRMADCALACALLMLALLGALFSRRLRDGLAMVADGERWDEV